VCEALSSLDAAEAAPVLARAAAKGRVELVRTGSSTTLVVVPLAEFGEPRRTAVAQVASTDDGIVARTVELVLGKVRAELRVARLEQESAQLSKQIGATFEGPGMAARSGTGPGISALFQFRLRRRPVPPR
jgi:hypothetical protein